MEELLEIFIKQKEEEYGEGWAKDSGAIRNQAIKFWNSVKNVKGEEYCITKLKQFIK